LPRAAEACSFPPAAAGKEELAQKFAQLLAARDIGGLKGLLWEKFIYRSSWDAEPVSRDGFLAAVASRPPVKTKGAKATPVDVSSTQLVQLELEEYEDTPDRAVGSCGWMFNFEKRIAVYDFQLAEILAYVAGPDGTAVPGWPKGSTPPSGSKIIALSHLRLPVTMNG
jgi:hypothetical protein